MAYASYPRIFEEECLARQCVFLVTLGVCVHLFWVVLLFWYYFIYGLSVNVGFCKGCFS